MMTVGENSDLEQRPDAQPRPDQSQSGHAHRHDRNQNGHPGDQVQAQPLQGYPQATANTDNGAEDQQPPAQAGAQKGQGQQHGGKKSKGLQTDQVTSDDQKKGDDG